MTTLHPERTSRIMIVDRSEVARSIISHILQKEMPDAYIVTSGSAEEALEYLHREKFDLITTALLLPGLDGLDLCHEVRKSDKQHLTPVIVVSSDADTRLLREGFSAGVTDYFNKSLGYKRLVEFIKDVCQRHAGLVGRVLYVEDSPSTAQSTITLMEKHGLYITHVTSGEEALRLLKKAQNSPDAPEVEQYDIVFTDFFLEGQMTGGDLLYAIRTQLHYSRQEMPLLVITIEDNQKCQAEIFHAGANDFITKPVIEEVLIARLKSLLLVKHQYNVLKRYSKDMYQLATTDSLTGVRNKRYLMDEAPAFIQQHKQVCLMMIDIDHFEIINEVQGHIIGDHILHVIGRFLLNYFAPEVMLVRFAGKKFTALLPNAGLEKGKAIAENLRQKMTELKPENIDITISIGLTSSEGVTETTLATLISDADNALHTAQIQGYNRTCLCVTHKNITAA
ncbi:diguanylate cyclase (GGDEF) domain-containing protein [Beggiatoa alba B18LD]|uniref:Diguanylate cyclase (GGDEF) domain-containing protein n=1 Tax=Beggiatoa alba B18LD TaxID=395493 RepID=I3CIR7_9GAMM|nr:response regulator [Beggiatoa alba]EIJ43510.1 diguanylate cyclase (GGDEF) domain-containing protein [Beggiatoa alba B18LD]